jgi:hypothetical protein
MKSPTEQAADRAMCCAICGKGWGSHHGILALCAENTRLRQNAKAERALKNGAPYLYSVGGITTGQALEIGAFIKAVKRRKVK